MKKAVRYFVDFTRGQEKWLNGMVSRGFRLVRCGALTYGFEQCAPGEYQYRVEFVGEKSYAEQKDYKGFLEGMGYRVFTKNINLNRSFRKARFRPRAEGAGKTAATQGAFNRELLIVEKKHDGKPFDLHTDAQDAAAYFASVRNSYACVAVICLFFGVLFAARFAWPGFSPGELLAWCIAGFFAVMSAAGVVLFVKYANMAGRYKETGKTNE
ncbi:MAG: DUF2812 domain-containing protein [Oscillospiraceae bacterium]|jgi:hypothetical protein|nr:DUF2812 domain-containing protein [Oscillospiraceae bacterium]